MNRYFLFYICCASILWYTINGFFIKEREMRRTIAGDNSFESTMMYYDPKSHIPFRMTSIENSLTNTLAENDLSSTKSTSGLRRIGFRSNGCTCQSLTCGCCYGLKIDQFNFNREGCMNFTYDPNEFAVNMNMLVDGDSIFANSFSAKNPPPLCVPIPLPVPPVVPISIEACAKLFDIHTPGQNLHMCFDFETRVQHATVLVLQFDCMRMGNDGLALVKPGEIPTTTPENQIDSDTYDEVTEIKYKTFRT